MFAYFSTFDTYFWINIALASIAVLLLGTNIVLRFCVYMVTNHCIPVMTVFIFTVTGWSAYAMHQSQAGTTTSIVVLGLAFYMLQRKLDQVADQAAVYGDEFMSEECTA